MSKLLQFVGWAIVAAGTAFALIIGTNLIILPEELSETGRVLQEEIIHPYRGYYAVGSFLFTTALGLIVVGLSGVIQALGQNQANATTTHEPRGECAEFTK